MDVDYTLASHGNKVFTAHTSSAGSVAGRVVAHGEQAKRVVADSFVADSVVVVAEREHDRNATANFAELLNLIGGHSDPNQSQQSHHTCLSQA